MDDEKEWISIPEAALEVGCSRANIHARIQAGTLKAEVRQVSPARYQWKIYRPDLEKWKAERVVNSRRGGKSAVSELQGQTDLAVAL